MKKFKATITIELCSDLCAASGNSYAGVIDQEVVYDEMGFPFIPARRYKGCMREISEIIYGSKITSEIFGSHGEGSSGKIWISDAVIPELKTLKQEIKEASKGNILARYLSPTEVLKLYTSLRTQTKIDEKTGTAEENTLRVTRVVNQFDPFDVNKNLTFKAELIAEGEDNADIFKQLENIVKATRNIGLNRNRGLGSIRCSISDFQEVAEKVEAEDKVIESTLEDGSICLTYTLKNTTPLVLSEGDKSSTVSYISGKSVLGALANAYLSQGKSAEDNKEFENLFLNGKVKYTNATLAIAGRRSYPAPLYINRLKKTKKYVNLLNEKKSEQTGEYNPDKGNQPKKLKTQYVVSSEDKGKLFYDVEEPSRELIYHHRHEHTGAPDALLYSMEVLSKGQTFIGEIYLDKEVADYATLLKALLQGAKLSFGKSRSVQYGSCELIKFEKKEENKTAPFKKDKKIVVTLKSDTILINEDDSYTVHFKEVKKLIAEELGISYKEEKDEPDKLSILGTTEVTGYNTLWRRKRPSVPAIKAGSAFVYTLADEFKNTKTFIGERNQEGFGEVLVQPLEMMEYQVSMLAKTSEDEESELPEKSKISVELQRMLADILKPKLIEALVNHELGNKALNQLSASSIGRVTLMFKESQTQCDTPDAIVEEWHKRIDSIKREAVRSEANTLIRYAGKREVHCHEIETVLSNEYKELYALLTLVQEKETLLKEVWVEYTQQYLAILKYGKKGE